MSFAFWKHKKISRRKILGREKGLGVKKIGKFSYQDGAGGENATQKKNMRA